MSGIDRTGAVLSEAEVVDWLKAKPRTLGWDAWMAYDRATANLSLVNDYSDRFSSHVLSTPLTGTVALVENVHWEHLYDVRLGPAQVSFEDSRLGGLQARLAVRAVSGTQLTVEQPAGGKKRILKLEAYSPLQGPRLVADVDLDDDSGAATEAMQVRIDLATGDDYRLGFAGTYQAQVKGGTFYKQHFTAASPAESRHCVINALGDLGDRTLAPAVIRTRAFPKPGDGSGDGAVLLFIAAKGSDVGSLPDSGSDWVYPIPAGRNATLLINNFAVMSKVLAPGVRSVIAGAEMQFDNPDNAELPVNRLFLTKGTIAPLHVDASVVPFSAVRYQVQPDVAGGAAGATTFSITRGDGGLRFSWKTSSLDNTEAPQLQTEGPVGVTALDYAWNVGLTYRFEISADGTLAADIDDSASKRWMKPVYRQAGALDAQHYQHFAALSAAITHQTVRQVALRLLDVVTGSDFGEIDALPRDGLLFPGNRAMQLESVHLPSDLALFGNVASRAGAFVLQPVQVVIEAGDSVQIKAEPSQTGLSYTVERVAGDGHAGTISASGSYTAATANKILSTSITVRVTATKGAQTSSVLVQVVARSVHVNPLVFATWPTAGRTRLAAGCVDGGELEWTIRSASGAALEEAPVDGDVLYDAGDRLYVPGTGVTGKFFSVDEVTASNPRTGDSRTASVLVVEKALTGEIRVGDDTGLAPNQVQLVFDGGEGPISGATWEVAIGGGSIDQNGRYTMDASPQEPFAVITATFTIPNIAVLGNYMILPLPLIDLDELKRVLA